MGVNFWIQFIIQIIIAIVTLSYIFKLEKERPTESINPKTAKEFTEL